MLMTSKRQRVYIEGSTAMGVKTGQSEVISKPDFPNLSAAN